MIYITAALIVCIISKKFREPEFADILFAVPSINERAILAAIPSRSRKYQVFCL